MNQAALELLIQYRDEASKGLEQTASKGGLIQQAFAFATGGLIQKGIEGIAGAAGDFFGGMLEESKQNQAGMAQLDAVLKSTGGSAGVTKDQVLGLVDSLSSAGGLSTATDDAVMAGENMLLTFTNIGKDAFPMATQAMLDMATKMNGGAAPSMEQMKGQAIQLGKALNDPTKGLAALSKVGVSFTAQQKDQIKALQSSGDMMGAQKIILDELSKEFGGSAAAAAQTFDGQMAHLGGVFDNVKQSLGDKLLPILTQALSFIGSPGVVAAIQFLADALGNGLTNAISFIGSAIQAAMPYIWPFIDAITNFWANLQGSGDLGASLGALFGELGPAIANAWAVVGPALGSLLGNILGWIGQNGPSILAQLASWDLALVQWVWDALPGLLSALGSLISQVWGWIQANGPGILTQLQAWGNSFWQWIVAVTPTVMSNLGTFVQGILTWIGDNGPGILQTLGQWAQAFLDWVGPMIPPILAELGKVLVAVGGWIIETALPAIAGKLVEWGGAFIQWVGPQIGPLLGELGKLLIALGGWLIDTALPAINQKIAEWGLAFLNWINTQVIPQLPGKLAEIAGALFSWFTSTSRDIGTHLVNEWVPAMWTWITGPGGVMEHIGSQLAAIAEKIWTWITGAAGDMLNRVLVIGTNLVEGIKQGIANSWNSFVGWVTAQLSGLLTGILGFFGIHSPSTVMADQVGKPLVQGIQKGWADQAPALFTDVQGTFDALKQGLITQIPGNWQPLGVAAAVGVVDGLKQGLPDAQAGAEAWLNGISGGLSTIIPASWKSLGVTAAVAVVDGLKSHSDAMFTDAAGVFDNLKNGLNTDIASKWPAIGVTSATLIATGFSQGFAAVASTAISKMDELWGEANDRLNQILDMEARAAQYGSATGGPGSGNNDYNGGDPGRPGRAPIPMANGGDFLITKPTLFLAGEAGLERATFTPLSRGQGGGGDGRNVLVSGNTFHIVAKGIDVDEISDQIVEQLEYKMGVNERIQSGQGRR